jgi:hypothetical protein
VIAFRQGKTETRVRPAGRPEYGADLSPAVPNDPTVKPWNSVAAEAYGPRKLSRKLPAGIVDLRIDGTKVTFTERPVFPLAPERRRRRKPEPFGPV